MCIGQWITFDCLFHRKYNFAIFQKGDTYYITAIILFPCFYKKLILCIIYSYNIVTKLF